MLMYLSPADLFPSMESLRLQLWIGVLAFLTALGGVFGRYYILSLPQTYLMLGMMASVTLSRLMNRFLGASASALLDFSVTAMAFYLVLFSIRSVRGLRVITTVIVLIAVYLTIHGLINYMSAFQDTSFVLFEQHTGTFGEDISFKRLRALGFLADPNDFAQFLLVAMAMLGVNWARRGITRFVGAILPGTVILTGMVFTRSRGGFLGLLAMLLLSFRDRFGRAKSAVLTAFSAVLLLGLNFTGYRTISPSAGVDRMDIWREGWGMFKSSPLWGIGYGWFVKHTRMTAHNSFVLCFAELGLLGYFFWIGLIVFSLYQLHTIRHSEVKSQEDLEMVQMANTLRIALYVFLVAGWFLSRTYNLTFYLLNGMVASLSAIYAMRRGEFRPLPRVFQCVRSTAFVEAGTILMVYLILKLRLLYL